MNKTKTEYDDFDVVVVGAGFAGLYMLHKLRQMGMRVCVIEAGADVGGTWYWNRYPGARCDVQSLEYSYSFCEDMQQEWQWSERYAAQPEILRYINHVADRFNLRRDIFLNSRVKSARFSIDTNAWTVVSDNRPSMRSRFLVMATGNLSSARIPEFKGLESYKGATYHTGSWPHDPIDFSGQRVAVIGTGSSGIQLIPEVAKQAKDLYVFQRTANFSMPARNSPLDKQYEDDFKSNYSDLRQQARMSPSGLLGGPPKQQSLLATPEAEREQILWDRWKIGGIGFTRVFNDVLTDPDANKIAAEFLAARIRETVHDPETAEKLIPRFYLGTKRLCADSGYYETFNRSNVHLVDLRSTPIIEITATGIRTSDGDHEVDALIFATGFDAMTGSILKVAIDVERGPSLSDLWDAGPRTYLGLMSAGIPNLFFVTGPGSPSVLSNVVLSIEQHVEWISECIGTMRERGCSRIEPKITAQEEWVRHVNELAAATLLLQANSWYLGANVPGKPRVFMPYPGGVDVYRRKCEEVVANGYEGFQFDA